VQATWTKTEALEQSRTKGTVLRCRLQILKPYLPADPITRVVREPCANILPAICPNRSGFWAQFALVQALRSSVTLIDSLKLLIFPGI
jgi:hypothetical protein